MGPKAAIAIAFCFYFVVKRKGKLLARSFFCKYFPNRFKVAIRTRTLQCINIYVQPSPENQVNDVTYLWIVVLYN